jgi:hypothetical protein
LPILSGLSIPRIFVARSSNRPEFHPGVTSQPTNIKLRRNRSSIAPLPQSTRAARQLSAAKKYSNSGGVTVKPFNVGAMDAIRSMREILKAPWFTYVVAGLLSFIIVLAYQKSHPELPEPPTPAENDTFHFGPPPLTLNEDKVRSSLSGSPLAQLTALQPGVLGIRRWNIGDFAVYRYIALQTLTEKTTNLMRDVRFQIVGEITDSAVQRFWLAVTGLERESDELPKDLFRLVTHHDLAVSENNPCYEYIHGYIPANVTRRRTISNFAPNLRAIGAEQINTTIGNLFVTHYRHDGSLRTSFEVWIATNVAPLGVVKFRSPFEELDLLETGNTTNLAIPRLLMPVLPGVSRSNVGCTSCHAERSGHESIDPLR